MKKIFLGLFLVLNFSCDDGLPDLKLPNESQEGLSTLGLVIDGKIWTNYGTRCTYAGCTENKVTATLDKYRVGLVDYFELSISANYTVRGKEIDQSFVISCKNITEPGTYVLDNSNEGRMIFTANMYAHSFKQFDNNGSTNSILQITKLDTINNIISGEFKGLLSNPVKLTEKVEIDQGRFDSKLDYEK